LTIEWKLGWSGQLKNRSGRCLIVVLVNEEKGKIGNWGGWADYNRNPTSQKSKVKFFSPEWNWQQLYFIQSHHRIQGESDSNS
jgi:hypothetical protein